MKNRLYGNYSWFMYEEAAMIREIRLCSMSAAEKFGSTTILFENTNKEA